MGLTFVSMENVRCIERAELDLDPRCNLIWGPNGSGKTSLLEGLFLLGRGRSFRTRNTERLIRHGERQLIVFGRMAAPERTLGIQVARGSATVGKVGGTVVSTLAELSECFPVQIIDPSIHKLVEEGAPRRRRWMDWAVFHVEQGFLTSWTRYHRALQQRNAALRLEPQQAFAWDPELARLGETLAEARHRSLEQLQPFWIDVVRTLVGREVSLAYHPGWTRSRTLSEALLDSRARDRERGITHPGPHRADVQIRIDGVPAREVASRGQQKLIAAAMILAQLRMVTTHLSTVPTLLLDDPAAELDSTRLEAFIGEVERLDCQLVLTSLGPQPGPFGGPDRVFHVEQGGVRPV